MEKVRYQKKIIRAIFILYFLVLISVLLYRFWYSKDERIQHYFYRNEISYNILLKEISRESIYLASPNEKGFISYEDNCSIDSLKERLNIKYIGITCYDNILSIYFSVDLGNYIEEFELWYNEREIEEFSDRDGLSLIKINNNWGILRNR